MPSISQSTKLNQTGHQTALLFALLFVLLAAAALASLLFGSVALQPAELFAALGQQPAARQSTSWILLTTVRLPRVLGGCLAGLGLASAGVILQSVMNNALASPNTIGVNAGAGFGVMLCLLLFPTAYALPPLFAFGGALATALFIFLLASAADASRTTIILAGIAVSAFLNAGINTLKLLDTDIAVDLTAFLIGSLSGLTLRALLLPACGILAAFLATLFLARSLNLLALGEETARSLGLSVAPIRFLLLLLASILAGFVVSYAGLLSFAGLVVPHICRRLFGSDARVLLPASALLGASFVLLCDLCGRLFFAPFELPAGIPMSLIGGPFFLYLLLKKKGGRRLHA